MSEASRRIPRPHHNFVPEYQMSGIPFCETRELASENNDQVHIVGVEKDEGVAIDDEFSSALRFTFPSVTRWIIIHNHSHANENNDSSHIRVYFSEKELLKSKDLSGDTSKHYFSVDHDETTQRLEIKCKELYIRPETKNESYTISVIAGLTNIDSSDFPDQTYENGFVGIEQE
jgi:bisphosphoglycerate-independent phosphoglycerate mutase (AlkP superfamily)